MGIIGITNLNDGINAKSDPTAIADGALQDCIGFDLTTEGLLETAGGLAPNDISAYLPTGHIQCIQFLYIGSTRYILATTTTGLYANGVLVQAGFTGRFKGVSFISNIYLTNGTLSIRFDGTTCYKWGIDPPISVPSITTGAYLSNTISTFESLTDWIANEVDCTISASATIKKVGSQSMKVAVATNTIGYSYVPYTNNLTEFSSGVPSTNNDYIRFWLYVDSLTNLDSLGLYIDVGDGTFESDYLNYSIVSPGLDEGIQSLGYGKTANVITEDTTVSGDTNTRTAYQEQYGPFDLSGNPYVEPSQQQTKTVTKTVTKTLVDPILQDQILSFWSRSSLFTLKSGVWLDIKIPKSLFNQNGDMEKGWDTISNIKLEVKASSTGPVNVYIDQMEHVGGSDLVGEYYFGYTYARTDTNGNVLHESPAARANRNILFSGPIKFDRHPLVYTNRPLSTDPQVNAGLIFCIGGSLSDFWVLTQINNNTVTTGIIYNIGEAFVERIIHSQSSEPAPAGTDMILHQNKIWMVGDPNYPRLLRSSDILGGGTIAPEAWPTRNAYDLENNQGSLTNIKLVNKVPIIKGTSGEWAIQVLDPTDFLQVKSKQVSSLGLIGQDSVVDFETSNIYPSPGGFVESTGGTAQFILPEIQPLIDSGMEKAIGCNAGLVNYFTYTSNLTGNRTAKIDMFRGKPRFSNINNKLLDWITVDEINKRAYAIENGGVYLLDQGDVDSSSVSGEIYALLKSKAFQPDGLISWNRMELIHNTGGVWYILDVYIDGFLKSSMPFKSVSRTVTNFRNFGPVSGYSFQFVISGNYTTKGYIYFPIRIYHGGK